MSLTRTDHVRPRMDALMRLWLLRLGRYLPHPLVFEKWEAKEAEANCLSDFRRFTGLMAPAEDSWDQLAWEIAEAQAREDPGGLLPLPATPCLNCLARLADHCGLDPLESQVLAWVYLVRVEEALYFPAQGMKHFRRLEYANLLEKVLGAEPGAIHAVLHPSSPLCRSGLIQRKLTGGWIEWLDLPGFLEEGLYLPPDNPLDLLRGTLDPCPGGQLTRDDYPHLQAEWDLLATYLQESLAQGRPGVNILLYGPPGTGKTQLAQALATSIDATLFEVSLVDRGGEPRKALNRLRAFAAGQMTLRRARRAMLLFDEMESSFAASGDDKDDSLQGLKAWLNHSLETNPVPAVWITNHIHALDPAFLRRFDLCLAMDVPPRRVRRHILDRHLGDLPVPDEVRACLAEKENLAPAVVARSADVARVICSADPNQEPGAIFTQVLSSSIQAMGDQKLGLNPKRACLPYHLDLVQADVDLEALVSGLGRMGQGRLCLYGPPGTGKTAFGRHLALRLDRPLMMRRASDILSAWLGSTEQNLAQMFRQAANDSAVLLLDEADSFLQDRSGARQSWEVTQVNELLTQLEAFEGIFIATTNLIDHLDSAALRRFDLKLRFEFLQPDQAWGLFRETAKCLGLDAPGALTSPVRALAFLTPGDFAQVLRQAQLRQVATPQELLARLREEVALKPQGKRRIAGF